MKEHIDRLVELGVEREAAQEIVSAVAGEAHASTRGPMGGQPMSFEERVAASESCEVTVVTRAWHDDHQAERAVAMLHSRVLLNGEEFPAVCGVRVEAAGGGFTEVWLKLVPSSIQFVRLGKDGFERPHLTADALTSLAE